MLANQVVYSEAAAAAFEAYDAACKQLLGLDFTLLTPATLLDAQSRREHATRITATVDHQILAALQAQTSPKDLGARNWAEVLMIRMQLSKKEANRRLTDAATLGPRTTFDGQPLPPQLPHTAHALADGAINADHVHEIRSTLTKAANLADPHKCAELEHILAEAARHVSPLTIHEIGTHALQLWNQDGNGPDLPAHTPGIRFGKQDADGLTHIDGWLNAETAAYLLLALKVWAAPGVNNPEDDPPLNNPDLSPLNDLDFPTPSPATPDAASAGDSVQMSLAEIVDHYTTAQTQAQARAATEAGGDTTSLDADLPVERDGVDEANEARAQFRDAIDTPPPTPDELTQHHTDSQQRWDDMCQNANHAAEAPTPPEVAQQRDDYQRTLGLTPPSAAARDTRSQTRRNHDALTVILRDLLMSKKLGQHNGLPVTLVISTTLEELATRTGLARTSVGTTMTIPNMIRLAAHAEHYLLVYREHTAEPLYLGKTKRLANKAQRLVMTARDRGCSMPGCPLPASECQAMHAESDWSNDGHTDITDLGLGCGPHNQLAFDTDWTTTIGTDGRIHWHPPPLLDVGQDTLNHTHHPETFLPPNNDDDP